MASAMGPKISVGQDENKVKAELEELVKSGWKLDNDQIQLEKTYYFNSYRNVKVSDELYILIKANLQFLTLEIMSRSQLKNHHPVLRNVCSPVGNSQFKAYHLAVLFLTHRPVENP